MFHTSFACFPHCMGKEQAQVSLSPTSQLSGEYFPFSSHSSYLAAGLEMLLQMFVCIIVEKHEQNPQLRSGKV